MKTKSYLTTALLAITRFTFDQGAFIYDQQSSDESYLGSGVAHIQSTQPMGQSFTPAAVPEQFAATGRNEILNTGRDAAEVLKSFAHELRQVLQMWTENMAAQVKEFLTEKYPGHDLARVADSFMHKFATREVSQSHAITHTHTQKQSRGIGI